MGSSGKWVRPRSFHHVGSNQVDQGKEAMQADRLTRSMRAQQTMASTPVMRATHRGLRALCLQISRKRGAPKITRKVNALISHSVRSAFSRLLVYLHAAVRTPSLLTEGHWAFRLRNPNICHRILSMMKLHVLRKSVTAIQIRVVGLLNWYDIIKHYVVSACSQYVEYILTDKTGPAPLRTKTFLSP